MWCVSNLGLYQDIVVRAAQLGGVEKLTASIGKAAVAKAAPALLGVGVAVGTALTLAATKGYEIWSERRRGAIREGEEAVAVLKDAVGDARDAAGDEAVACESEG